MKAIRIFAYAVLSLLTIAARPTEYPKRLAGEFSVRQDRPRLYLNAADLDKVRIRIATTHQDEWRSVLRARESEDLTQRMLACAFSYQVDRGRTQARRAINAALEIAGKDLDRIDDDLRLAYRIWPESVVYDWCYDQFTPEERQLLLTRVHAQLEIAGGKILETQPPHAGHLVNYLADAHIPAGIAFREDDPSIFERALKVTRTQIAAKNLFYQYGASSQGNSYGVTHVNGDYRILMMLLKPTGVDLFARFPFYRDLGYYWIYTRRPDGQLLRNGDDWLDDMKQNNRVLKGAGDPDVNLWTHPWLVQFLLYGAAKYGDPYLMAAYKNLRDIDLAWTAIEDIIWRDASAPVKGPESLPTVRYLAGTVGTLLFRTGWGMDDVVGMFKVMPLFAKNHDHLDRLSFQIYCRGALAIDSGLYEGSHSLYDSDHWLNYLQRTIAHNSLLIRDPGEKLVYRGKPVNIDGGQFYPSQGANADTIEAIADPQWSLARVIAAEADPRRNYAYVAGDATRGYGAKAESVQRTFVFLQGNKEGAAASFVIADQATSRQPEFEKVWLIHSIEEPAVEGSTIRIRRAKGRNSGGLLISQTLIPEQAVLRKVGGPGQEFLVNGVNYATEKGGDAEGGAWRVEVTARDGGKTVLFLHALQVFPRVPGTTPVPARRIEGPNVEGAEFPDWSVVLLTGGEHGNRVQFASRRPGKRRYLVLGFPASRIIEVNIAGGKPLKLSTTNSGALFFEAEQPADAIVSLSTTPQRN